MVTEREDESYVEPCSMKRLCLSFTVVSSAGILFCGTYYTFHAMSADERKQNVQEMPVNGAC
jgi:hypothetical protein